MKHAEKLAFSIYNDLDIATEHIRKAKKNIDILFQMYLSEVEDKDFLCTDCFFKVKGEKTLKDADDIKK